ncbi:MAG: acylphosphatase, partial [Dietzia sp.]
MTGQRAAGQDPEGAGPDQVRLVAWVHGHVQGVGFRW